MTDPRGPELASRLLAVEADLSAWMDEVPGDDARALGEAVLVEMDRARDAIARMADGR